MNQRPLGYERAEATNGNPLISPAVSRNSRNALKLGNAPQSIMLGSFQCVLGWCGSKMGSERLLGVAQRRPRAITSPTGFGSGTCFQLCRFRTTRWVLEFHLDVATLLYACSDMCQQAGVTQSKLAPHSASAAGSAADAPADTMAWAVLQKATRSSNGFASPCTVTVIPGALGSRFMSAETSYRPGGPRITIGGSKTHLRIICAALPV